MYYSPIGGFEYHDKVTVGASDYYIYVRTDGLILVRKVVTATTATSYCLTRLSFATVYASPDSLPYARIDQIGL